MNYDSHKITKIKFKQKEGKPPKLTFEYTAKDPSNQIRKAAKDKFEDDPHIDFHKIWAKSVEYWKDNIELILGNVFWELGDARPTTIEMEHNSKGLVVSVRYFVTISTQFEQDISIGPPSMPPGDDEEHDYLIQLHEEAIQYLQGKRAQMDMFSGNVDEEGQWKPEATN